MTMIMILLNIVTSVYFSSMLLMALYANITFYVNFIVYFMTSPRIRQAYWRFLVDMLCLRRIKKQKNTEEQSETFWARGMEQGDGNHELEDVT